MQGIAERADDCRSALDRVERFVVRGQVGAGLDALGKVWRELDRFRDELASAGHVAPGYNELRDRPGAGGVTDVNPDALETVAGEDPFIKMQLEQNLRMAREGLEALCTAAGIGVPAPLPSVYARKPPSLAVTVLGIALILLVVIALLAVKH